MTNTPILGSPTKRKEDKALLNGSAKFMADLNMPEMNGVIAAISYEIPRMLRPAMATWNRSQDIR